MKWRYRYLGFTTLCFTGFVLFPDVFSEIYHHYIFLPLRILYDGTLGKLPFPSLYIFIAGATLYVGYVLINKKNQPKTTPTILTGRQKILQITVNVLVFLVTFYWVWGFHYFQPNLKERWSLNTTNIDSIYLRRQIENILPDLLANRQMISDNQIDSLKDGGFIRMEDELRKHLVEVLPEMGWKTAGNVRIRNLQPEGFLLRLSTAGIYIPYVFEGHVDYGLHPLQLPFTVAHEMAHGYGVTDEGDCNTIALIVCLKSENPVYKYASLLTYFRYLYFDPRLPDDQKSLILASMPEVIKKDLDNIKKQSARFPDVFPVIRDFMYESYLRLMGVEEGLQSYHSFVDKIYAIQKQRPEVLPELFSKSSK
jgi:hypothetical protein